MKRLDCCNGVVYWDRYGGRTEKHDHLCRSNIEMLELLAEEGIGMAGRKLRLMEESRMRIAMDCETGGLDPGTNPLLHLTLWRPEGPCFDVRVKGDPERCHPRALQANGLDPREGEEPRAAAEKLVAWWKGLGSPKFELVGQNVGPFDVPFAKQLCGVGVDVPWGMMFDYHYLDTATLAFALQGAGVLHFGKWSLANICQVLGILYDPHLAKADAAAAWWAWHRMESLIHRCHVGMNTEEWAEIRREILPAMDLRGA